MAVQYRKKKPGRYRTAKGAIKTLSYNFYSVGGTLCRVSFIDWTLFFFFPPFFYPFLRDLSMGFGRPQDGKKIFFFR